MVYHISPGMDLQGGWGGGGAQSNMHVCGSKRQRLKRKQTLKIVCSWQLLANGIM
jgi:hypothetical protein